MDPAVTGRQPSEPADPDATGQPDTAPDATGGPVVPDAGGGDTDSRPPRDEGGLLVLGTGPASPGASEAPVHAAGPACGECGGSFLDGYCGQCGAKQPEPGDHVEIAAAAWAAGVSDRGVRHHRNEDAVAVAVDEAPTDGVRRAALVVCDGVSTARRSDEASQAAAGAAAAELLGARSRGLGVASALVGALSARLDAAADAAAAAVRAVTEQDGPVEPTDGHSTNPSCTLVAAVIDGDVAVVGNVGDSRGYWFPDSGEPTLLTRDDSWAQEVIRLGGDRVEAQAGRRAHTITRWIGVDCPDHVPAKTSVSLAEPGWLLLCSDGLWNYASEPRELGGILGEARVAAGDDPLGVTRILVDWANAQGGRDNITVALVRAGPPLRVGAGAGRTGAAVGGASPVPRPSPEGDRPDAAASFPEASDRHDPRTEMEGPHHG